MGKPAKSGKPSVQPGESTLQTKNEIGGTAWMRRWRRPLWRYWLRSSGCAQFILFALALVGLLAAVLSEYGRFQRIDEATQASLVVHRDSATKLDGIDKLLRRLERLEVRKYPNADGMVADFSGAPQRSIRTALDEEFSLFSDSATGAKSTVRYKRVLTGAGGDGDGFLRIHYWLSPERPDGILVPYVGIYSNFANPVAAFDLSDFMGVHLALRMKRCEESSEGAPPTISIILADTNVSGNGNYAFAESEVPAESLQEKDFVTITRLFDTFRTPVWSPLKFPFNYKSVFRIGIKITGRPGESMSGYVDIDEIRFIRPPQQIGLEAN